MCTERLTLCVLAQIRHLICPCGWRGVTICPLVRRPPLMHTYSARRETDECLRAGAEDGRRCDRKCGGGRTAQGDAGMVYVHASPVPVADLHRLTATGVAPAPVPTLSLDLTPAAAHAGAPGPRRSRRSRLSQPPARQRHLASTLARTSPSSAERALDPRATAGAAASIRRCEHQARHAGRSGRAAAARKSTPRPILERAVSGCFGVRSADEEPIRYADRVDIR